MKLENEFFDEAEPMPLGMPLGTILNCKEFGGLHWHDEQRSCPLHGPYLARVVFAKGQKQSDGYCPECRRILEQERAKVQSAELAQMEAERELRRIEESLGRACIPEDFAEKSFETFDADTDELKQALDLCKRFVSGWDKARAGGYGLLFFGNPGTGKSHLAVSILKELIPQGVTGLYTRVSDLIGYIRAQWRPDSETSSYAAVRRYVDLDLLVIDELGVQSGTANEQALLFEVIDARLSENRPTIFLSNLKPKQLAPVIGERLVDRIKGKCVPQQFSGESRRKPLSADVFGVAV
jgi:DNA replication protein DnaC